MGGAVQGRHFPPPPAMLGRFLTLVRTPALRRQALHLLSLLLLSFGLGLWAPATWHAAAAQTVEAEQRAGTPAVTGEVSQVLLDQWNRRLDIIDQQLYRADTTAESAGRFYELTAGIRKEAREVIAVLEPEVQRLERRLETLGPAPEEGAPAEAPEMTEQRRALQQQLQKLKAQVSQAKLAMVRADELDKLTGSLTQKRRFEALFRAYPPPWSAETWRKAVPEFFSILNQIARSPLAWWQDMEAEQRREVVPLRLAIQLVVALVAGWLLRRWLLRRYSRDPAASEPSYTARLLAALASATARGILPALIFAGLLFATWPNRLAEESLFWTVITTFFAVMVFFSLAWAVPQAILSPDLPQWRLLPVLPENARKLGWRFTLLAALFAISIFLFETQEQIGVSDSYFSLATFLVILILALSMAEVSRARYWNTQAPPVESQAPGTGSAEIETEEGEGGSREPALWRFLRRLIAPIALVGVIAAFLGYADLADFLIGNLLLSILTLVAIAILRGLGRELIGGALRSGFAREALEIRHVARNRIKFWLRTLLDATLLLLGGMAIAAIWSSPFGEFWSQARQLLAGITIGGVTISVTDLTAALAVFAVILLLTRLGQRFLNNKVLPQTGFDSGVQNSLSAGFGYLGIILAAVFGISALGIDLSNIALIAGALSVGIGFGLQTIVSNFVSGIILLIERPIKVGDWVLVGGNEGTVKRITVRSTELTTFQRASVIIPNSEFISTSVINWTHKDHYGRIEVAVGVAYGSDVEKVRDVLLDCAQKHQRVLTSPEPQVLFMNFGNSSLDFELRCFTSEVSYRLLISSDLRFAIDKAFREAGIEIPFPQSVVHFADQAAILEALDSRKTGNPPASTD